MDDRDVDEALDRAIREMMSVAAKAHLRARVLTRLERPQRPLLSWTRIAGAISVAAAAVILAVVLRSPSPDAPSLVRPPEAAVQMTKPPREPVPMQATPRHVRQMNVVGRSRPARIAAATVAEDELPHVGVLPLQRLEPIAIAPIDSRPLAPAPIALEPLMPIAELRVTPLAIIDDPTKGEL